MPNKRVGWKICKSRRVEKVQVGWGKSKNANRVDSFIWHLRVVYLDTFFYDYYYCWPALARQMTESLKFSVNSNTEV